MSGLSLGTLLHDQNAPILRAHEEEAPPVTAEQSSASHAQSMLTCRHEALFFRTLQYIDDCIEQVRLPLTRVEALQKQPDFRAGSSMPHMIKTCDSYLHPLLCTICTGQGG